MDCYNAAKGESDLIVVGFVSGKINIVSRFGKIDKSINEGHKGSITAIRWSNDG